MEPGPVAVAAPTGAPSAAVEPVPARRSGWRAALLPGAIAVAVTACYLVDAGRPLDFDSAQMVGANVRTPSFADALTVQTLYNNHPLFSVVERLVAALAGSSSDLVLRLAPAAFGGLAVALLVAALRPWLGTTASLAAGAVMATNPTVVELSRSVRGYSLLLLAVVASTAALARLLAAPPSAADDRRLVVAYVVAVAVGLGTHLYMAPVVLAHVALVLGRRRWSEAWVRRWLLAGTLGAAAYVAILDAMFLATGDGGRAFQPGLPVGILGAVVGRGLPGVVLGAVVVVGAVALRGRRDLQVATAVVLGAVAVAWLVLATPGSAPRFYVWLVPAVAALAGVAVARRPWLLVAVAAVVGLHLATVVPEVGEVDNAMPTAGRVLARADRVGARGCVTSFSVRPTAAYADGFVPVLDAPDLERCDVVVVPFPNLDADLVADARRHLVVERPLAPADEGGGLVFLRDSDVADRICVARTGVCDAPPS